MEIQVVFFFLEELFYLIFVRIADEVTVMEKRSKKKRSEWFDYADLFEVLFYGIRFMIRKIFLLLHHS
ncbi:hypothetical protein [Bacillus atrophaeus]|uniref:hypothetical protein n=1 Tax=Bacillus atrophaeus TaxID=1452 RepID=UPI00227E0B2A|nr:hypothetical protein [Bacillus atrophaeus]MCY8931241.1 hypothetical protein [Bacillus atrophaeus]MCY8942167.1 hypothetical protein [Bacillus atrophaeus]